MYDSRFETLFRLSKKPGGFSVSAYDSILEALDWMIQRLRKKRHLSADEFVAGYVDWIINKTGMLAPTVLIEFGFISAHDLGTAIFHLIDADILQKTADDSIDQFPHLMPLTRSADELLDVVFPLMCEQGTKGKWS